MKTVAKEWGALKKELSRAQQKDGEGCFYCGALLGLTWFATGLTPEEQSDRMKEIRAMLRKKGKSK